MTKAEKALNVPTVIELSVDNSNARVPNLPPSLHVIFSDDLCFKAKCKSYLFHGISPALQSDCPCPTFCCHLPRETMSMETAVSARHVRQLPTGLQLS